MLSNWSAYLIELLCDFSTTIAAITLKNNLSFFSPFIQFLYKYVIRLFGGYTVGKQGVHF